MTSVGQCAHACAVRLEAVEQHVEHRADAKHFVVGDAGPLDARAEVAAPHARGHSLEIPNGAERHQHETQMKRRDAARMHARRHDSTDRRP